jgi:hypothetical protein
MEMDPVSETLCISMIPQETADVARVIAPAVSRRPPTVDARVQSQVMWYLRWTKWHWGRVSPTTSVSPANSHSTNCSIFINDLIIDAI